MEGKLGLRPLAGGLGAEIIAYDFDSPPEEAVRSLQWALIDFHLLLFRGHALDPARQLAFTRLFGSRPRPCSPRTPCVPGFPEVARFCNRRGERLAAMGHRWHSDGAHLQEPTAVSVHHLVVAAEDCDTLYTGLAAAYERLSPEERRQMSRMRTRLPGGVAHPLVLRHPVTGRLGLYVTLGHGAAIVDEFGRENRAMRDALERHLGADGTYYRHRWQAGDTLVIDNFTVAHRAARGDAAPGVLHRTSIYGSTAWWRSGASLDFAGRALMAS
jgi:taurine dioxygenase